MSHLSAVTRCAWATNQRLMDYHDTEWGVPLHDDQRLFELLVLEGAQAGLSWDTVLAKRAAYCLAFDGFDPRLVAAYDDQTQAELLAHPGIIRNRRKIAAAIINARVFLAVQQEYGSFDAYLWQYVDRRPIINQWPSAAAVPASTALSVAIANDLKQRGMSFVGPTIIYAYLQSAGLVNDHTTDCFRHQQLQAVSAS